MAIVQEFPADTAGPADWRACPACADLIYVRRWQRTLGVCPECGAHGRLPARDRIDQLADVGSFVDLPADLLSTNASGSVSGRSAGVRGQQALSGAAAGCPRRHR